MVKIKSEKAGNAEQRTKKKKKKRKRERTEKMKDRSINQAPR